MDRRILRSTTAQPFHGLLDSSGTPIPKSMQTVDILALPEINRRDFPDVPTDMEMRLLTPANGSDPLIVLYHPDTAMHLEVPLIEMNNLAPHVEKMRAAVVAFGMGVVPGAV